MAAWALKPLATAVSLIAMALALAGCPHEAAAPPRTQTVQLGGERFELELALDSAARYHGLSDRPSLDPHGGMLFVFPQARRQTFVMRRCHFPIDLIYLDTSGRIVTMHAMQVEPLETPEADLERYGSVWPVRFAIEVAGGTIARLGLEAGSKVALPVDALVAAAE